MKFNMQFLLALSLFSVALADLPFHHLAASKPNDALFRRQTTYCGTGNTCAEACGEGYIQCGPTFGYCYNPAIGDTCCGSSGHYCPASEFCAPVEGYCCENGQDPATCAASQGFTLPASTASSATIASTTSVPAAVTITPSPTSNVPFSSYSPEAVSITAPATFTGAAATIGIRRVGQVLVAAAGLAVGL